MIPPFLVVIFVFVLGTLLGSFLNVCILRIPLSQSIVRPPSRCAACGLQLPGWLNIPIFGYFLLQGRARCCASLGQEGRDSRDLRGFWMQVGLMSNDSNV